MNSKINIRDFFWNYPKTFSNLVKITNPLFSILFAGVLGFVAFSGLTSSPFVRSFVDGRSHTKVTEGVVGSLISTNPMYLTENFVDLDFYKLVYEKFLEIDENGEPVKNIAIEWEEKDELEHVFKIRQDLLWHNGEKLTADDVVWNFEVAMLLAGDFSEDTYGNALEGVEVEKIDTYTVKFVLPETNATFWEAISVYILPKSAYEHIPLQDFAITKKSTLPLGCGLFKVSSISSKGFALDVFEDHWLESEIKQYRYLFFEDYNALNSALKNNEIDIVTTYDLTKIENLEDYPFFRTEDAVLHGRQKLIYFNTRREKFSNVDVRQALSLMVDKEELLRRSDITGDVIYSPLSSKSWAFDETVEFLEYDPAKAAELLDSLGYEKDSFDEYYVRKDDEKILAVELSFFENEANLRLVKVLEELLKSEGVLLQLRPLTYDQILREILPTRDFEMLLYEVEVTIDPDQYNLWHSLRIDHPMLNISGYEYSRVDILLERARTNLDVEERKGDYSLFQKYLIGDAPVIFLYHPRVSFVLRNGLKGFETENIYSPSDRYENISEWYWKL